MHLALSIPPRVPVALYAIQTAGTQTNTMRQSITQHLFYIQWYICQGDMFRPSRSSSDPPRKQIQVLFSFPALWDPKCIGVPRDSSISF